MPLTVPVNVAPERLALSFNALCVAVETGLSASEVLFTLPNPTMVAVIPLTVPVNVAPERSAFKSNAACVAVEMGLDESEVLFTLSKPTMAFVRPMTVDVPNSTSPVKVGLALGALAANEVVTVAAKFASSLSAAANSSSVFNAAGTSAPRRTAIASFTNAVVAICVVFVSLVAVGAVGVPVRSGLARGALASNALCVAVEMGLAESEVLSTLPKPTAAALSVLY